MQPSTWTTIIDDERACFRLEVNDELKRVFLHLVLRRWDTEILRSLKDGLMIVTGTLKALGHKRVSVLIPEGDDKLYRFQVMFGLTEVKRSGGHILLEKEC